MKTAAKILEQIHPEIPGLWFSGKANCSVLLCGGELSFFHPEMTLDLSTKIK